MKRLSIDRFEGKFAICEDDQRKMFAIELSELPKESKEGDIISISEEGEITVDAAKTESRRKDIIKKQRDLWED